MISSIKSARTLGLAGMMVAVALMVVASVGVASSSAAEWGECFSQAGGAYKDGLCNEKTGGSFEWEAFAAPVEVKSKGRLELTDEKGGPFSEAVTVRCPKNSEAEGLNKGTVGPGSTDEITEVTDAAGKTTIECERVAGTCPAPVTATAVHLPWHTKLIVVNGEIRDELVSGTAKEGEPAGSEPGWTVKCSSVTDTCERQGTEAHQNTAVSNVTGGVDTTFDAKSTNVHCSRGGTGKGKVRGTVHVLNPTGVVLSVK